MSTPEITESTAPGFPGSLAGWRGLATVWLPVALTVFAVVWAVVTGGIPLWLLMPVAVTVVALSGDPLTRLVLHLARDVEAQRRAHREVVTARQQVRVMAEPKELTRDTGSPVPALRGGFMIGILERIAVAVCLATGYPNGVAVVIAVKGLARYGEFSDAHQREQFIIGTLTSMLWAGAGAGAIFLFGP